MVISATLKFDIREEVSIVLRISEVKFLDGVEVIVNRCKLECHFSSPYLFSFLLENV